jgi:hypothetical protein
VNFFNIPFFLLLFVLPSGLLFGQKQLVASVTADPIVLDGVLNEAIWKQAAVADSFTVNFPKVGSISAYESKVQVVYDQQAMYIAAQLYDPRPDSVLHFLSQRDDFGNADYFGVLIDPYGAGQNGFGFYVTAAGVEIDAIVNQNNFDFSWNAVWRSAVVRTDFGWSVEIRIPLSQLRFPTTSEQHWKINFKRSIRRNRESSYWSEVDPKQFGELAQSGELTNVHDLIAPLRLSFSPYTTGYVENYYNSQLKSQDWRFRQRFGMDMKLGLSESFTIDATLVPDFGQTVSDKLVLNLSPFEVRYTENRPFFLEGMDLFGISDIFYSRRIGSNVLLGASKVNQILANGGQILSAPSLAQLVNTTKISGRTKKGLGIGVLNAIEKRSYIQYIDSSGVPREELAHPLSNYNVVVLSQNLKNSGNVSFINTNVYRQDIQTIDNVSAAQFLVLSKNRTYSLSGNARFSVNQVQQSMESGHTIDVAFEKIKGSKTYTLSYYECSDSFNPNELGFLAMNNFRGFWGEWKWVGYQQKRNMLRRTFTMNSNLEYLYAPSKFSYLNASANGIVTFKNFLTVGYTAVVFPLHEIDQFESRHFGIPVQFPQSLQLGGFYSSDYSKKYALDFSLYNRMYAKSGMNNLDMEVSPRLRLTDRLFLVLSSNVSYYTGNYGFVNVTDTTYKDDIILGFRNRSIVTNNISADYTFTNRMGLKFGLNHYWQEVNYSHYGKLLADGTTVATSYTGIGENGQSNHNTTYDALTLDVNFRWIIYPGSEIRIVWKYNIYASKMGLDYSYFKTFNDLFQQPQLNSFSVKALFFLDAGRYIKRTAKADQ